MSTFGGALLERGREDEEEEEGMEKDGLERSFMGSLGSGR
ncbi:hypothetical protein LILAB_07700 [Corallococcus macrosporus]|uniref:Uncharacterized protein n=1 Tax=Myxococcus fulvus (strain ATCC BAA-855 / HW-1) TaxID=483219 RepID=F8CCU6_MYXFH|nr:hypothetical protein LILAB_07700 [Corallococcus macrosporus]